MAKESGWSQNTKMDILFLHIILLNVEPLFGLLANPAALSGMTLYNPLLLLKLYFLFGSKQKSRRLP
jgi:hypothetical protein